MFKNKWFQFSLYIFLIPLCIDIYMYPKLPESVPVHFNFEGVADGFAPKFIGLFGLLAFLILIHVFTIFMMSKTPKANHIPKISMIITSLVCPIISVYTTFFIISASFNHDYHFMIYGMHFIIGILMIALGNYLPKTRRNYVLGIKTPWTIDDDDNWNQTHRIGGYCFVTAGIVYIILTLVNQPFIGLIFLLVCSMIPVIYSYFYYQKKLKSR